MRNSVTSTVTREARVVSGTGPRLPPIAVLAAVTATGPMAMHLFVPSMPGLVETFSSTPARVQLTLTLYMLALAVATLMYGPLSDRYGRRPVILAALAVYAASGLLCGLAASVEWLIAGRVFQAVGGSAGLVLGRAMVRDCFERDRAASVIATLSMIMAVVPALSPAVGGYLDVWLGWRAGFVLLAVFGLVVLMVSIPWLHETNPYAGPNPSRDGQWTVFALLLRDRVFVGFGLHSVCTLAAWYALVAGAPYVMVTIMGRAPSDYGLWFVLVAGGWIVGNFVTARVAMRLGVSRLVLAGSLVALAASSSLVVLVLMETLTPSRLFIPIAIIGFGHGLSQPGAMSGAIGVRPGAAGRASGLLGFMQMACGAAAAQLLGVIQSSSALPMVGMVAFLSLMSFVSWGIAVWRR